MSEKDEKAEVIEETKAKQKSGKKQREKRVRKTRKKKEKKPREGKLKESTGEFFNGIWKIIKFILQVILAPFWYTVVLLINSIKFLRDRNDNALTDKDKKYLSLIPTFFFMMFVSIVIIFLIFYFQLLDPTIEAITDIGFWRAVGQFFVSIGLGIYWLIDIIFVKFFFEMIIVPFGNFMRAENFFWASIIIVAAIIILTGLGILIYHAMKSRKIIKAIAAFFRKIAQYPKDFHKLIREKFVLKYLIGEKYIGSRNKRFFWVVVLIQFILTSIIFVLAIVLGVYNYVVDIWRGADIFEYSLVVGGMLFVGIGLFASWFFIRVLGVVTEDSETYAIQK